MIKICIFYESNDDSKFDICKEFFECIISKISLMSCTKTDAVYQNVLDCQKKMANLTFRLILSFWKIRIGESRMTNSKTVDKD